MALGALHVSCLMGGSYRAARSDANDFSAHAVALDATAPAPLRVSTSRSRSAAIRRSSRPFRPRAFGRHRLAAL